MVKSILSLNIIICVILLNSCAGYIYSPTINLPPEPMKKGETHISAAFETMPKVNADWYHRTTNAVWVGAKYAIDNNVTLQGRFWTNLPFTSDDLNGLPIKYHIFNYTGFSLSSIIMLKKSETLSYAIIPAYSQVFDMGVSKGQAFALYFAAWLPQFYILKPYTSFGTGYGSGHFLKNQDGFGLSYHLGFNSEIIKNLNLVFESYLLWQRNMNANVNELIPGISTGLSFNTDIFN
ncbi:MAG: hypothetical protein NT007_08615 [Candidatus Kapabacteria bacterium]|nr:hypothetical protein [Candidatus Kapabacteria bacterium]